MKKNVKFLAVLLAGCLTLQTLTPVGAAEYDIETEDFSSEEVQSAENKDDNNGTEEQEEISIKEDQLPEEELPIEEPSQEEENTAEEENTENIFTSEPEEEFTDTVGASGTIGTLSWSLVGGTLTIKGTGTMTNMDYSTGDDVDEDDDEEFNSEGYSNYPWKDVLTDIRSIVVMEGVENIADGAFWGCTELESVNLADSVKAIGKDAFIYDDVLRTVSFGKGLKSIGANAFDNCEGFLSLKLPGTIETIGANAFDNCNSIETASLGTSLREIGDEAFTLCGGLTKITLPATLKKAGANVFDGCDGLEYIRFLGNLPSVGTEAFLDLETKVYYPAKNNTWTKIIKNKKPYGAELVEWQADQVLWELDGDTLCITAWDTDMKEFKDENDIPWCDYREDLTEIKAVDGVQKLGAKAFSGCKNVTSMWIARSVRSIADDVFSGCTALDKIQYDAYELRWKNLTKTVNIPADVKMEYNDFACGDKADWELAGTVLTIKGSGDMWDFTVANVEKCSKDYCGIAPWVYSHNTEGTGLPTELKVEEKITALGLYSFSEDETLEKVILPSTIKTWDARSLFKCKKLKSFKTADASKSLKVIDDVLYNKAGTVIEQYPSDRENPGYVMPDEVKEIAPYAFAYAEGMISVSFSPEMTIIQKDSFTGCTGIKMLILSNKLKAIEPGVFADAAALDYVVYGGTPFEWREEVSIGSDNGKLNDKDLDIDYGIFDAAIYQAEYILSKEHSLGNSLDSMFSQEFPSHILVKYGNKNNLKFATNTWRYFVKDFLSAIQDPSSVPDGKLLNESDIYLGLLSSMFQKESDTSILMKVLNNGAVSSTTKISGMLDKVMSKVYHINFSEKYADIFKQGTLDASELLAKSAVSEEADAVYKASFIGKNTKLIGNLNKGIGYIKDVKSYYDYVQNALTVSGLPEAMKAVCNKMYAKSKNIGGVAMQTGVLKFTGIMNGTATDLTLDTTNYIANKIVCKVGLKGTLGAVWGEKKAMVYLQNPYAALFEVAYAGSTTICDLLWGSSSIAEGYYKMTAMSQISDMIDQVYADAKAAFQKEHTRENALTYLYAVNLKFRCMDQDCATAASFVKAVDGAWLSAVVKALGKKDTEQVLSSINSMKSSYKNFYTTVSTQWIGQLMSDYPQEYEVYKNLIEDSETLYGSYEIHCPVDVEVLDPAGNVVAYTNGSEWETTSDKVTVMVNGSSKFVWIYSPDAYQIRCRGTGTGTMSIYGYKYGEGNYERSVMYRNVSVTSGCSYTMTQKQGETEATDYLTSSEGEVVTPKKGKLPEETKIIHNTYEDIETPAKPKPVSKPVLNMKEIPLKVKQSTAAVKVSGIASGDSIKSWKSSNTKVATVNSKGKITARKKGTATLTVTLKSGKKVTAKIKVQTGTVKTTKIQVSKKTITLKKGKKSRLSVTRQPLTSQQKITYQSANKKVAQVNTKGVITARKKGKTTITVKSGSKKVKVTVVVK